MTSRQIPNKHIVIYIMTKKASLQMTIKIEIEVEVEVTEIKIKLYFSQLWDTL